MQSDERTVKTLSAPSRKVPLSLQRFSCYNCLAALHEQKVYLNRHIDNEIWKLRVEIHFAST